MSRGQVLGVLAAVSAAVAGTIALRSGKDGAEDPDTAGSRLGRQPGRVTGALPAGWQVRGRSTALARPVELFTAASYPVRRGGACGPDRALADMPPNGALVFALDDRPSVGRVRLEGYPRRPEHIRLLPRASSRAECFGQTGWGVRFREHGRAIILQVALGPRAGSARRRQVERFLDSLRFGRLPAPPPDPYAGWPMTTDAAGDSFRAPPGWPRGVLADPKRSARPRTLFMTASGPLPGLPGTGLPVHRSRLPRPGPAGDRTVLWIVEPGAGEPSPAYPAFPRPGPWPRGLSRAQDGRLRAGASCGGNRFEVLIAGPDAPTALKAARAAGFSCGVREFQLSLARRPYLGVSCRRANSIACDTVQVLARVRSPVVGLSATIGGATFALHRIGGTDGLTVWQGRLGPAGLSDPSSPLRVTVDRRPDYWAGRHPTSAVVRLAGRLAGGRVLGRRLRLPLRPGCC